MPTFSLLVPTWNNLPYLRLLVESLWRHSTREHQLVVHANDGGDGTREWLRREGIEHTASDANIGICHAVNLVGEKARGDSLIYHFSKTSTGRIRKNDGRRQFLMKWGMTQSGFDRYYLRRGQPAPVNPVLPEPQASWGLRWQALKSGLPRRLG